MEKGSIVILVPPRQRQEDPWGMPVSLSRPLGKPRPMGKLQVQEETGGKKLGTNTSLWLTHTRAHTGTQTYTLTKETLFPDDLTCVF